jgi:hypothetical protein
MVAGVDYAGRRWAEKAHRGQKALARRKRYRR